MFIELVDVLRCPVAHEESWLVLATRTMEGRDVIEGTLGCPVCEAEYPIVGGIAHFGGAEPNGARAEAPDEGEALRLVALLDLTTTTRGYAIVTGDLARHAPRMRELTDVPLLLVNPPPGIAMGGLSALIIEREWSSLPLAVESAHAIALDDGTTRDQLAASLDVMAPGARVLGPLALPMPEAITELARDDRHWLGERMRAARSSGIVTIGRRT